MKPLAVAHLIVGIALIPMSAFMGIALAPALLVVPLWFVGIGVWLFRPSETLRRAMRATHLVALPLALWIVVFGFYALSAASESAEHGGGLLGAYGLIPIVIGTLTGILSVWSLIAVRRWSQ